MLTVAGRSAVWYAPLPRAASPSAALLVAPASDPKAGLTVRPVRAQDPGSRRGRRTGQWPGRLRRHGARHASYGWPDLRRWRDL